MSDEKESIQYTKQYNKSQDKRMTVEGVDQEKTSRGSGSGKHERIGKTRMQGMDQEKTTRAVNDSTRRD